TAALTDHRVDRVMPFRRQLAAFSPIPALAVAEGIRQIVRRGDDPRDDLRKLLLEEYSADRVLLVNSGTHALQAALAIALERTRSKVVALPAYSCYDVVTATIGADARISFYDVAPDSLGPNLESLERVLAAGVAVLVIAQLYGLVADWDSIGALADRYDTPIIEDAAQGQGASWRGRPLGSVGAVSILSFGRGKGWTGGSGGAVLARRGGSVPDGPLANSSSEIAAWLRVVAQWGLGRPGLYGVPYALPGLALGETVYKKPTLVREMSRGAARALMASHAAAKNEARKRRENATELLSVVDDTPGMTRLHSAEGGIQGFLRMPVRTSKGMEGFRSVEDAARSGIAPGYPAPLYLLPAVGGGRLTGPEVKCPGAELLARNLVTVPVHSRLTAGDVTRLIATLRSYSG
ncbi:MAG: DegT/DnrJ/EryC1/StrS family aminotransferase, partial [Gemmatimonadaceae bacterium]